MVPILKRNITLDKEIYYRAALNRLETLESKLTSGIEGRPKGVSSDRAKIMISGYFARSPWVGVFRRKV